MVTITNNAALDLPSVPPKFSLCFAELTCVPALLEAYIITFLSYLMQEAKGPPVMRLYCQVIRLPRGPPHVPLLPSLHCCPGISDAWDPESCTCTWSPSLLFPVSRSLCPSVHLIDNTWEHDCSQPLSFSIQVPCCRKQKFLRDSSNRPEDPGEVRSEKLLDNLGDWWGGKRSQGQGLESETQ